MCTATGSGLLRVAAALWIVAGVGYLVTETAVAEHLPGYSYSADYISELGNPLESPMAAWMNGAFIAQGVAFALASAVVTTAMGLGPSTIAFLSLALLYGAGSATVGIFPSAGADTPAFVHLIGATAAIVAGNLAVLTAGVVTLRRKHFRTFGLVSLVLGVAGLICAGLLVCGPMSARVLFGNGACERGAVYTIIGWQLLAGVVAVRCGQRLRAADSE